MIVRSLSDAITTTLSNSINHPNVAGLVVTGIFYHFTFLGVDIAAMYYAYTDKELQDIKPYVDVQKKFNFFATVITFAVNLSFSSVIILCSVFLYYRNIRKVNYETSCFQRFFSPLFYVVNPTFDSVAFWRGITKEEEKKRIAWIVCFMLLSPCFSLASHVGYIFAAWLTKPSLALSVALLFLGVSLYLFLMFRQLYMVNKGIVLKYGTYYNLLISFLPILSSS